MIHNDHHTTLNTQKYTIMYISSSFLYLPRLRICASSLQITSASMRVTLPEYSWSRRHRRYWWHGRFRWILWRILHRWWWWRCHWIQHHWKRFIRHWAFQGLRRRKASVTDLLNRQRFLIIIIRWWVKSVCRRCRWLALTEELEVEVTRKISEEAFAAIALHLAVI